MMYDQLLFIESPVQIMIVLLIALIVFGPKRLPEIGKQLGSALRELRKATNDVVRSFNVDHEPDPAPYQQYNYSDSSTYTYPPPALPSSSSLDLTDYTIVGQTAPAASGDSYPADAYADYTIADSPSGSRTGNGHNPANTVARGSLDDGAGRPSDAPTLSEGPSVPTQTPVSPSDTAPAPRQAANGTQHSPSA